MVKRFKGGTKVTIVPRTKANLPVGTLMAMLGEKQTNLGKKELLGLLNRYR